jgi:hypothetical protein
MSKIMLALSVVPLSGIAAEAQSLSKLCDPRSPDFSHKECKRQLALKMEILKCQLGGAEGLRKRYGAELTPAVEPRITTTCRDPVKAGVKAK